MNHKTKKSIANFLTVLALIGGIIYSATYFSNINRCAVTAKWKKLEWKFSGLSCVVQLPKDLMNAKAKTWVPVSVYNDLIREEQQKARDDAHRAAEQDLLRAYLAFGKNIIKFTEEDLDNFDNDPLDREGTRLPSVSDEYLEIVKAWDNL